MYSLKHKHIESCICCCFSINMAMRMSLNPDDHVVNGDIRPECKKRH